MLDWNDLKWFAAVADAGSFREAASRVGVNHTTLSRRLRALEEDLGLTLLDRSPSGLRLTEAGRELHEVCRGLVEEVADLQRRLAGQDQRPEGRVSITYPDGFAPYVVATVAELASTYPLISITHVNSEDFVDLSRREADIAVRAADNPPESLVGRRIGTIQWGLYGAKAKYPVAPAELVLTDPIVAMKGKPGGGGEVDDPQSIRELAASGLGLGLLMSIDGDRDSRLTFVGRWPGDLPPTALWLLMHPDVSRARRVRVVADLLYERLRALDGAFVPE